MKEKQTKVAVTSRSFSKHEGLRKELLKRYPQTKFNDSGKSLSGKDLVDFLSGYEKAITALETLDWSILKQLPKLQVVGKYGVGLDMINLQAMSDLGIKLGWTAGVNCRGAAELTLSLMIASLRKLTLCQKEIFAGRYRQIRGRGLTGRTVGIIGCGHIGKDLVCLLKPFKCKILVNDIVSYESFYQENNIEEVELEDLLRLSDLVTLHIPLDTSTRNIIGARELLLMKSDSILLNVARGGIVDESALLQALQNANIGGAAFDVMVQEPPVDFELLNLDNFLITPHIGGSTEESIWAMGMAAISGLDNANNPLSYATQDTELGNTL
jgi:phosphoglycerate dehydrogenase-like enzyme